MKVFNLLVTKDTGLSKPLICNANFWTLLQHAVWTDSLKKVLPFTLCVTYLLVLHNMFNKRTKH